MYEIIPIILFSISTTLTPGPNNLMMLSSGLNFGVKKSLPHYLGICIGFPIMIIAVALGLGMLFTQYPWLHQALQIIGACYMLYLAWSIITSQKQTNTKGSAKPITFLQAALFQWVNPKAWIMTIGAVSMFTTITHHYLNEAMIVSAIYFFTCIPCVGIWMVFGALLQRWLKDAKQRKRFNYVMAILLVISIVIIFVE